MTTSTDTWQLPLSNIIDGQRARIIPENEDFVPSMLETWHKGEDLPSWMVWIGPTGPDVQTRDAALHAAKVMCAVTACDYLVLTFDTHMSTSQVNPTTGKPWEPGEMQRMCDTEGYCETGNIRDNLVVAIVRRSDQKLHLHSIPYHFHADHSVLFYEDQVISEWPEHGGKTDHIQGRIPDALREYINQPTLMEYAIEFGLIDSDHTDGIDHRLVRLHQMLAGVQTLQATALAEGEPEMFFSVLNAATEEEREIMRKAAERIPFMKAETL